MSVSQTFSHAVTKYVKCKRNTLISVFPEIKTPSARKEKNKKNEGGASLKATPKSRCRAPQIGNIKLITGD
jgi:hypothetical protein